MSELVIMCARRFRLGAATTCSFLLLASSALPALSQGMGFFSKTNSTEEFIMSIPSDCEYISESRILGPPSFFIFHTCHRGGGAWLQEVPRVTKIAPGILYVPNQSLSNGEAPEGYWCSNKARRQPTSMIMKCTRDGWQQAQPYQ